MSPLATTPTRRTLSTGFNVEALTGRLDDARTAFEKMLTYANHVALYSEEMSRGN